ncbi:S8 family peptidase [Aeromonas hydrophila]|uniref:S8 family peptidase n=1 Tax=Aeromonas hydrophila TaxID=644 RepID=UPI0009B7F2D4|nr:S8 family peptidase [Aeromonas hydrophila]
MRKIILGNGEKYAINNEYRPKKPGDEPVPYPLAISSQRVAGRVKRTLEKVNQLPNSAMPDGEFVAAVTLHPSFLAKSYFPSALLNDYSLVSLGSKEVFIKPEVSVNKAQKDGKVSSSVYFVAGKKESFNKLLSDIENKTIGFNAGIDLGKIEDLKLFESEDKIKSIGENKENVYEVILHLKNDDLTKLRLFIDSIYSLDGSIDETKIRYVDGLSFCFVKIDASKINELAKFSFVRAVRVAPKMNFSNYIQHETEEHSERHLNKKELSDIHGYHSDESNPNVAVFDGGLYGDRSVNSHIRYFDLTSSNDEYSDIFVHGELVTSAVVYGAIDDPSTATHEIVSVDHYKVFCEEDEDDIGLVNVLDRIVSVISTNKYKIVNISVGPEIPCPDDEPNLWTSTLDKISADGKVLIIVAAGNTGEILSLYPEDEDLAKIQPPADMLNGISIGAANSRGQHWKRASYSSIGPGRRPGYVKPDAVFFGGDNATDGEKVHLLSLSDYEEKKKFGTSFASPLVTRIAARLDNLTLGKLTPATLRALLVHYAEGDDDKKGCGWGRINGDIDQYIHCDDDSVTVIYQGVLTKSAGVRAAVPCPTALKNTKTKINLLATLCFYTDVDTNHPVSYSRAGIEVTFRPHSEKFDINKETGKPSVEASTRSLFNKKNIVGNEQHLRSDAHKWETCYRVEDSFLSSSFNDPCFDIKYLTRDEGHSLSSKEMKLLPQLAYSLVVTLSTKKECGLYDAIRDEYDLLQPIELNQNINLEL